MARVADLFQKKLLGSAALPDWINSEKLESPYSSAKQSNKRNPKNDKSKPEQRRDTVKKFQLQIEKIFVND